MSLPKWKVLIFWKHVHFFLSDNIRNCPISSKGNDIDLDEDVKDLKSQEMVSSGKGEEGLGLRQYSCFHLF